MPTPIRVRRWRILAAMAAVGALVLSGCGSDGDDSATDDVASEPSATDETGTVDDTEGTDTAATDATEPDDAADGGSSTLGGDFPDVGVDDSRSFIYITNDPIGINEFLGLGKIGIEAAAETFGGTSKVFESTDVASRRANVEAAIDEEPDVIVLITFDFTDLAEEFATDNPDQEFVLIDDCPADPPENLHCAVFREQEASYLLGTEAGLLTKSNKIGSVVSVDIPFLHRYSDTFALAARAQNDAVTDTQLFIGGDNPFADPATAKERALALAAEGVDQVFAVGAGSNGGVMEAAAEKGFFSYGVDVNQCPMAPGHVVDNTIKKVDVLVVTEIGQILAGTATGLSSYGLAEGGMTISSLDEGATDSQCVIMEHPDILDIVKKTRDDIISGAIDIPDPAMG